MRVDRGLADEEIRDQEYALRAFAEAQGYRFGTLFHEHDSGSHRVSRRSSPTCLKKADAQVHTLAVRCCTR